MHMCGIGGILRVHPAGAAVPPPEAAIPEAWLDILDESIKHRGPDGAGRFRDRVVRPDGSVVDVALVHRRLSILDHAGGGQPMVSPRGRPGRDKGLVAVVFNGCIYNHRELRKELRAAGHEFVSDHSDTEVLVHGWREWGEELHQHLEGMYALAVWDRGRGMLVLARDFAGEKPLYVLKPKGELRMGFGSSAAGLMMIAKMWGGPSLCEPSTWMSWVADGYDDTVPGVAVESLEPRSLRRTSLFEGTLVLGGRRRESLPERRKRQPRLSPELVDSMLRTAVERRLESDVPLGCFLSGGVDSSLVATFAKDRLGELNTFSVRMPDAGFDESAVAERVAGLIGTRHETLDVAADPASDLVSLIEQLGLPFGDSSLLPTYWISRAARQRVKVALSGDGGDELFCGYERYVALRLIHPWLFLLRPVAGLVPLELIPQGDPKSRWTKLARLVRLLRQRPYPWFGAIFDHMDGDRLLGVNPRKVRYRLRTGPDPEEAPAFDFDNYLPGDLLRKVDTASMCVALEVRAPFLDRELVRACLSEPLSSLMPRGQRKGLLRQVARKYLPADIVDRPKMGFAIPISEWFRTDYGGMKTLLMDRLRSTEPFGPPSVGIELDMRFIERMIGEHMERRRDHGQRLYMLLVLSIWAAWVGRQMAK